MLKANTGASTNPNPKKAGMEAALQAMNGLDSIKMLYVYASCDYDLNALIGGIAEELPGIQIIGNTSFSGIITPDGFVGGEDGFVGMMAIADDEMSVGIAAAEKEATAEETGEKVAKLAMERAGKTVPPDYFYMVALPGEEEFYLKGITKVIGRVPFFGGSAADNTISGNWSMYTDKGVLADGVAVAFFYTNKKMSNVFTGAYKETKDVGLITKVINNRVLAEIDGIPALEKYAEWRGMSASDLKGSALLAASIVSPLGIKDRMGDLVAIRHPMNGNEDLTINVGNNLAEATAVIRMEASVDELISSTGETLAETKKRMGKAAGAYHLVHCGGRRAGIGDRIDEVVELIKKEANGVPFIVEFTFGEYGFEADGCNTCGGLMLSFTGFEK